jgi:hypothetical protein
MSNGGLFSNFPARFYLEKYYSHVGVENEAFMRTIAAAVHQVDELGTVVELGGGPSLCGMFAMTAATRSGPERVVWVDIGAPNLAEIAAWVRNADDAFDYAEVLRWLAREFEVDPVEIAQRLRAASWDLRSADLWGELPGDLRGVGDVVGSYFLAEAATDNEQGFVELTTRVLDASRVGAHIVLAYARNSGSYRLEDATLYPALAVNEDSLPRLLDAAGLRFEDLTIRRGPLEDPPARPGYDGMVFACGRLAVL